MRWLRWLAGTKPRFQTATGEYPYSILVLIRGDEMSTWRGGQSSILNSRATIPPCVTSWPSASPQQRQQRQQQQQQQRDGTRRAERARTPDSAPSRKPSSEAVQPPPAGRQASASFVRATGLFSSQATAWRGDRRRRCPGIIRDMREDCTVGIELFAYPRKLFFQVGICTPPVFAVRGPGSINCHFSACHFIRSRSSIILVFIVFGF